MSINEKTVIIGAGPVGLLTAIYLAKRKDSNGNKLYPQIKVYEKRAIENIRYQKEDSHNYNLTLSHRGLNALAQISTLKDKVINSGIIIKKIINCIRVDDLGKGMKAVIRGERLSIQRSDVVVVLLDYIEQNYKDQIQIEYLKKVIDVDFENKIVHFLDNNANEENGKNQAVEFNILIGCDGARSGVGKALRDQCPEIKYQCTSEVEPYISVNISHSDFTEHGLSFEKDCMYTVQPRSNNGNIIILPNHDSFGFALNPWCQLEKQKQKQKQSDLYQCCHTMKDSNDLYRFFIANFPNIGEVMYQNFAKRFGVKNLDSYKTKESAEQLTVPKHGFETIYYSQFHHPTSSAMIIGDAAHTMVPTVGQGINCGFEDVFELNQILDQTKDDWTKAPAMFTKQRKQETEAIQIISQQYVLERHTRTFEIRMVFDIIRNILVRLLPFGIIQPNVMHLLSQTSIPYSEVLSARKSHFRKGCSVLLLSTLSFVYFLTKGYFKK
ncbi:FAD/NAD(P)-binding domain-containing protein [Neoconidiobolus thromboides FSU 785]|nr:FAD/NAD(P)-binding domain-containing protein [Neoconidiobolus thromboides FSU 785]